MPRASHAASRPTTPAPTTQTRSPGLMLGVPDAVERGFHVGGEDGAARRHGLGQQGDRRRRHDEAILVRMQDEDEAIGQRRAARR